MGRSRHRRPLLGRKAGLGRRSRTAATPPPRLGRRKALWRFVGALALAPLAGTSFGQAPVLSPAPGYGPPGAYAPGMTPPAYGAPGYGAPGYGPPGAGPMVAPPPASPQPMTPQNSGGIAIPQGGYSSRFGLTTGAGDGLGWENGYQSFNAWVPVGINTEGMVMYLDARGFASFDEAGGGNFTLGYRYYMPQFKRYVGVYGGYDIDAGNDDSSTFHQFVVGAESVGDFVSYRVNGYIPLDYDGKDAGGTPGPFAQFQGNNLLLIDQQFTRYQYGGVDGEIGGLLPLIGKYGVSGFVGGYYLTSDVDDTLGFKTRAEANVNDDLQLGVKLTTDEIFDTNIWATVTLRTPRGGLGNFFRKDWLRPPSAATQMDRGPEREYRIATDVKMDETRTVAIDPTDGQPILVLHVDPNSAGGIGTVEDPAGRINGRNTPGYDIVYVQPGQLTTAGPIQLFDNQRLLSTSVQHAVNTQLGPFLLPGFTGGPRPVLQNVAGGQSSVIELANNNEVSGFVINGAGGQPMAFHQGIVGEQINRFNINRNNFTNVVSGATISHFGNADGNVFSNNIVAGLGTQSQIQNGLSLTVHTGVVSNMRVENNLVTGFLGNPFQGDVLGNNIPSGNGLFIHTRNRTQFDNLQINNNIIAGNNDGIQFLFEADSRINANLANNDISNNIDLEIRNDDLELVALSEGDGIEITEYRTTENFDPGFISGTWQGNRITGNEGNGINSSGLTGTFDPDTGETLETLTVQNNVITDNGLAGVYIAGPGTATYANNIVSRNGSLLHVKHLGFVDQNADHSFGAGFDIEGRGFKEIVLRGNIIEDNFGDAIEIDNGNLAQFFYDVTIDGNHIATNLGRGIDVLNRGDALSFIDITNNTIERNVREGIYVVNTASTSQTQNLLVDLDDGTVLQPGVSAFTSYNDPTHGMQATGAIDNDPFLVLNVIGNTIDSNGTINGGLDQGQGLVIRVGTAGGGINSPTFPGGFASDGFAGVVADVSNNFFGGHMGSNVYVESFVSTVDPPATTGDWDEAEFDITGEYHSDPLARLDLTFRGNTFDPASRGPDFNNLGAFYTNEDGFKSRTRNRTAPDPDGPFNSTSRRRNAQRLAFRDGLPPFGGPGEFFQYPGMGPSTFRVDTDMPSMFIFDNEPYNSPFDANGELFPGINFIDQMPYGWGRLP